MFIFLDWLAHVHAPGTLHVSKITEVFIFKYFNFLYCNSFTTTHMFRTKCWTELLRKVVCKFFLLCTQLIKILDISQYHQDSHAQFCSFILNISMNN